MRAFPDGRFIIDHVEPRSETSYEVDLTAPGTHLGTFDFGIYQFKASGRTSVIRLRQLFELGAGKITFSSVSFDVQDLIDQLTMVDYSTLQRHLEEIHRLRGELEVARHDPVKQPAITQRLGTALDAARTAVRPYFAR